MSTNRLNTILADGANDRKKSFTPCRVYNLWQARLFICPTCTRKMCYIGLISISVPPHSHPLTAVGFFFHEYNVCRATASVLSLIPTTVGLPAVVNCAPIFPHFPVFSMISCFKKSKFDNEQLRSVAVGAPFRFCFSFS